MRSKLLTIPNYDSVCILDSFPKKILKNYLMTYPSISLALDSIFQESRMPLEPTASPSRPEGGPGTDEDEGSRVKEIDDVNISRTQVK